MCAAAAALDDRLNFSVLIEHQIFQDV